MENYNIHCEFSIPKTWENLAPATEKDIWQYSEIHCQSDNTELSENTLIENAETGANFFVKQTVSYGDFLIITFLMIFLIWGIMKFLINFFIPKLMNFKR